MTAQTRRYVVLTALHWFPVGLTVPVMVLLAQVRGLALGQIGFVFAVFGVLGALLELPTGGLADVLGRRPVLLAAAPLHVLSCLAFAVAQDLPGFLLAVVLMAVGRTLFSGPLEAWSSTPSTRSTPEPTSHRACPAAARPTAVSAMTLAMALGGTTANIVLPLPLPFLLVGGLVLLRSLLCLRLPGASRDEEALLDQSLHDGQHLLDGLGVADPGAAGQHGEQVTHPPGAVAAGEQRRAIDVDPA